MRRRAVFLDRDGVINSYVYNAEFGTIDSPATPDEFRLISGVGHAVREFRSMGAMIVVVSNQPGIAKGRFCRKLLDAMTDKMLAGLEENVDGVYYCLHHPAAVIEEYRAECDCRKPKPGLLLRAARELGIDLERSVMIGDGLTDVIAGRRAGTYTILTSPRKCYYCDAMAEQRAEPDALVTNLAESVGIVAQLFQHETTFIGGANELHI